MNPPARSLNLLRHPRRMAMLDGPLLRWGLLGWALGLLLGGALGSLLHGWHSDLLQQQQHWTRQLALQAQQQNQQRVAREQDRVQREQQAWWRSVQAQEQRRLALQAALQREAAQGLRLARWQADEQRLWLQGQWPPNGDLPGLQARLGQALGQPWRLHSLHSLGAGATAAGLLWTLEAPWQPASAPSGAAP